MTTPSGARGELVDLFVDAVSSLPGDEWMDPATYAAFALGGPPLRFSAAPDNRIPIADTVGAEHFIAGRTMGRERYLALIRSRLVEVIEDGLREDFIVEALVNNVSAQFERLTDTRAGNESRAKLHATITRHIADPSAFRSALAGRDPSVTELSDEEVTEQLTRLLNRLRPAGDAEVLEHLALKTHWEAARQQHLAREVLEAWRDRSVYDV
ncbi:MAG: hypothetical protein JWN80_3115 [Microbacteriaceae bacterium]|nr:hypothetical protein [Microbacteriaceae bacterium]